MTLAEIAFFIILLSMIIQIINLFKANKILEGINIILMLLTSSFLLSDFIIRSFEIKFIALTNMFESLIFYSAMILLATIFYRHINKEKLSPGIIFGSTMIAFILLSIASSPIIPKDVRPPMPALQSYWLVLHVSFAFIGEAFFALSFITSISFLITKSEEKKETLELLTVKAISIGYPIFTAGAILFGAIWAHYAWGRFWGWDPKETWALITWLTYTIFLHLRLIKKAQNKTAMIISIVGFLFTLFTFFGVNFLLAGLHSYN